MTDPAALPPGAMPCPRCGAAVASDQDWCLACGAAARTRLAPGPNWKLPVAALALVVTAAVVALALAFVALTNVPAPPRGATGPTGPTVVLPAAGATPAPTGPTGATGAALTG